MSSYKGRLAKVAIGSTKVTEMGTWSIDGITFDFIDDSEFGDTYKTYQIGMGDFGTVSFSGWFDPSNASQVLLESYMNNASKITDIRFYIDNTSYYRPNTSGLGTGATDAGMFVQSMKISFDKGGIGKVDFVGRLTGPMILE